MSTALANTESVELFIIGSHWDGVLSMSPFGTKLATWMRLAGIPHQLEIEDDPRKGPKKKSPWVVTDGVTMGDSQLIIEHFKTTHGVDPDAHLDPVQRAQALTLRRMFEDHFGPILDYALFCTDEGWAASRAHFDFLPAIVRLLLLDIIRKDFKKESWIRGIGRHTPDEIAVMAANDLRAAATLLGDKPYFCGDEPTSVDCTVYGFLSITLWSPIDYFGQQELRRHDNLVAFCERMRARFFSELVETAAAA